MRMADPLGECTKVPGEYKFALERVVEITGIPQGDWRAYTDTHQISTRHAGKSSCAFLGTKFPTLEQAVAATVALQAALPTVNLELVVAPDGRFDQGDGLGSYDRSEYDRAVCAYVQPQGFGVALLVDAQNVNRHFGKPAL